MRTRRAYFDCRFGQLHVRTAFSTSGGFDEGVTLFCLHPQEATSRILDMFLPAIAADRSVYAPDLPGCGESDAAPSNTCADAADAVADLAAGLQLRQIDVLGFGFGAGVALALAATKPALVRRLVLIGTPPLAKLPLIKQDSLVMRDRQSSGDDCQWTRGILEKVSFVDLVEYPADWFAAPQALAERVAVFLAATS